MTDISQVVKKAAKAGKMECGLRSVLSSLTNGTCHAVILSRKVTRGTAEDVEKRAELAGVSVAWFEGTSLELGELCGKPFVVSALSITDAAIAGELSRTR